MNQKQDPLADLHEIRDIMDRSSRFISLSGLSGIAAGLVALIGAAFAKWYLPAQTIHNIQTLDGNLNKESILLLISVAMLVLLLAFCLAAYFTARKAQKNGHPVWDSKTERMLINLFIPLAAGGTFCAALIYHNLFYLLAPAMLIFYGCALLNASKYTINDIRYLGICEIILGLLASFFVGYGLLAWALGFGVLHMLYGTLMYFKYER